MTDIFIRGQRVIPPKERIEALSTPEPNSGCWLWLGAVKGESKLKLYGTLVVWSRSDGTRRRIGAHRYAYEVYRGPIPDGLHVCHRCDNPLCVNPDHLFAGTRQENTDDRERKGRNVIVRGEQHGNSRLTAAAVTDIKRQIKAGVPAREIARRFGVSIGAIKDISSGRAWRHIPSPPSEESSS